MSIQLLFKKKNNKIITIGIRILCSRQHSQGKIVFAQSREFKTMYAASGSR